MPSRSNLNMLDHAAREGGHVTEVQRRRLMLAFAEILAESGLEKVNVGRVCKRAGLSRRTFYELFDGRETCFMAVLENTLARISRRVLPAYAHEGRWRERIRMALAAILEFLDEEPALAHVCLIETLKAEPAILEYRTRILDALTLAVDEGRTESRKGKDAEPPALMGQSTVGGVVAVLHARLLEGTTEPEGPGPLLELLNPLMSMIVHPYLGPAAARRELDRHVHSKSAHNGHVPIRTRDPFKDIPIRITFRTARVLATINDHPGASNRMVGDTAGVTDPGQISKLLKRLESFGLIENCADGQNVKGEANAWQLTQRGHAIQQALSELT